MPHKRGTDLGGIRSLDGLRLRCYIDEQSGCWRWRLACGRDGSASTNIITADRVYHMRGRRAALLLTGKLRPGSLVWQGPACSYRDCCNPAHARQGSHREFVAWQVQMGMHSTPAKRFGALKAARARAKVTPEIALAMRTSDETLRVLAARYGVCESTVSAVRRGTRCPDPAWRL